MSGNRTRASKPTRFARYHYTITAPVNMCAQEVSWGIKNDDTFLCRHFRFEARQLLSANLV